MKEKRKEGRKSNNEKNENERAWKKGGEEGKKNEG